MLRPLDAIRPYRLEGDTILPGEEEQTRFDFWRQRLTDGFIRKIQADDGVLLNLASAEMKRLFDWRRLAREVRIITPEFRIREGDRLKTIVVYTKMCRGEMTRFALKGRIDHPESLKTFEWEGFRFDPSASRGESWFYGCNPQRICPTGIFTLRSSMYSKGKGVIPVRPTIPESGLQAAPGESPPRRSRRGLSTGQGVPCSTHSSPIPGVSPRHRSRARQRRW